MNKMVVLYGSSEGQTAKIANALAAVLREKGEMVDVIDGQRVPTDFSLAPYHAIIIGASLHVGGYQSSIRRFIQQHRQALEHIPTAFFSVSLTEAYPHPEEKARLKQLLAKFLQETGWHPQKIASFAGSLAYSKYGFIKRMIMQRIARKVGAPTDTSRDYEYTNWEAVTHFAESFVAELHLDHRQSSIPLSLSKEAT